MSNEVIPLLVQTAQRYGLDPNTFVAISHIETGGTFKPTAQNPHSSAGGLFQFTDKTWNEYGQGRDKYDPVANADAGARLMRNNILSLHRRLGRYPTPGEIYLAHQQGAGGAAKILANPNVNAVQLLGFDHVNLNVPGDLKARVPNMTAGEFASLWDQKIQKAMGGARPYEASPLTASLDPNSTPGFTVYDALNPQKTSSPVWASQPLVPIAEQRRAAIERENAEKAPGFFGAVGAAAYSQNWMFIRDLQDKWAGEDVRKVSDPDWRPTADDLKLKFEKAGVPVQYWNNFDDATSEAHLDAMISRTYRIMEADQKLARLGTAGNLSARIGVALADPVNWAITAAVGYATAGTGVAPALAARMGVSARTASVAVGAAEGVAGNLIADSLQQADNKTFETADYLYSVGTGLVMGGAFGAFGRNTELAGQIEQIGRKVQKEAEDMVAPAGSSVGAAQAPASAPSLSQDTAFMRSVANDLAEKLGIDPVFKNFRFDLSASLQKNRSGLIKVIGRGLIGDPVGPKKGTVAEIGVDEIGSRINRQKEVEWTTGTLTQWKAYKKRMGIRGRDEAAAEKQFREQITEYVWTRDPSARAAFEPEVKAAGDLFAKMMGDWTDHLNNPGALDGTTANPVRGAGNLQRNPNYAPRIHDLEALRDAVHRYGFEKIPEPEVKKLADGSEVVVNQKAIDSGGGLTRLVSKALQDANPEMTAGFANKFAYGYLKKLYSLSAGQEIPLHRIIAGEDMDGLRKMLTELTDDVADKRLFSDAEIDEFVSHFEKANVTEAASSRLKSRAMLNELTTGKLYNVHTGALEEFSFKDLLIKDAHFLMSVYNRQMAGRVALAKWKVPDGKGGYLIDGIDSDAAFDSLLRRVREVGMEDGLSRGEIDKAVRQLQFAYNHIVGYPQYDMGNTFFAALKLMGDYNFLRVMGQVGFAQIPELGNVAANAGLKVFFQSMPAMADLWRNAKTGKLGTKLGREVEATLGMGTDWIRNSWHLTADDAGVAFNELAATSKANRLMMGADKKLHTGKKIVNAFSGMAPINTLLQRWNGQAIFYRFHQTASKVVSKDGSVDLSKLKTRDMNRLKGLGLSEDMMQRVFRQIQKHKEVSRGMFGEKLEALNIRQWDDLQASAAFEAAAYRQARTIVMENDPGQMAQWMSHPLAKAIFQFRAFMIGAHTKILLKGLNYRDLETWTSFAATAFIGAMTYTAQTYLNSIGRRDQEDFLKERLSVGEIAKGGILRSSWFSTLALPAGAVHGMITGEPLTGFRTTGLASGFLGNPTLAFGDSADAGLQGLAGVFRGDAFSRKDAQALRSLLPFQNLMLVTQLFNVLTGPLPKYD